MLAFTMIFACAVCLTACESVVPAAWVYLKMDSGYTIYTTNMYSSGGDHIYYFENEEDATDKNNSVLQITFYPRILGPEEIEIDGVNQRTTLVDMSGNVDFKVYVIKSSSVYSAEKSVYLNGSKLTASSTYNSDVLLALTFENVNLIRGNPNGQRNNAVNFIEYN